MKDKRNILIAALVFCVFALTVAFAALSSNLTIEGTAKLAEWDVEITGIEAAYTGDAFDEDGMPTFTATTATFSTVLVGPGDKATYTITVENKGTIDAKLDAITLTPQAGGSEYIDYSIKSQPTAGTELAADGTHTVVIEVSFKGTEVPEDVKDEVKTFTGTLSYVQAD